MDPMFADVVLQKKGGDDSDVKPRENIIVSAIAKVVGAYRFVSRVELNFLLVITMVSVEGQNFIHDINRALGLLRL